jgi:hypothetical protein
MDERSSDPPTPADVTTIEQTLLDQIEMLAANGTLTADDRHQLSSRVEILNTELRACLDQSTRI